MKRSWLMAGIATAAIIMIVVGAIAYFSTLRFLDNGRWVNHSHVVLERLEHLLSLLKDAQRGSRGFVLTNNPAFLTPFENARHELPRHLAELRKLLSENPDQLKALDEAELPVERVIEALSTINELRRTSTLDAAAARVATGEPKQLMDQTTGIIQRMKRHEEQLLAERERVARSDGAATAMILIVGYGVASIFMAAATIMLARQMRILDLQHQELQAKTTLLQEQSSELQMLAEMSDMLQTCTPDEMYGVISSFGSRLFPGSAGALHVIANSRDIVEPLAQWGTNLPREPFMTDECWGLRRGRLHTSTDDAATRCPHLRKTTEYTLCLPLLASSEASSVLMLAYGKKPVEIDRIETLALAVADQIALSVANMKLRETLRNQAIRDPLTGLYNRRYMEETLMREAKRAARKSQPLSMVMIDVDHFKRFNDTFGHAAGDVLLKEIGGVLRKAVRSEDIVCRYGGEEFAVILPDTNLEHAQERAEKLRELVSNLQLHHKGQTLGPITMSAGAALHKGDDPLQTLQAADKALYQAKQSGRNRVVLAQ